MFSTEDRAVQGLSRPPLARRASAVSQVLRAIREEVEGGSGAWDLAGETAASGLPGFRMLVANDIELRERAYALAHRVYLGCGYADGKKVGRCVSSFDAEPQTLTLLAEDAQGRPIATISLVFDSPLGLPCDVLYMAELAYLRTAGRKLVEVTRLAIDEEHAQGRPLLIRLFNFIYIFARRVRGCDDLTIEVNPRHASFYHRLLGFEPLGAERPCPRVKGAPAVMLRLDLVHADHEIRRVAGKGAAAHERSLYPWFYSWLEEGAIAEFLARTHRPMTLEEAKYFGLDTAISNEQPHDRRSSA